ncbi:MAG TPA: CoA pyrophosphatase [Bacillota bacterium]|nr:CoA pyrophosphatase [Bacillota bacterium]HQC35607.1 CoA pyrophosphatase [Bacillota bacterium]
MNNLSKNTIYALSGRKVDMIITESCKRSAVCLPLVEGKNGYELLFELRTKDLRTNPGDICFPGGRIQEGESPQEAALREICEELNLESSSVETVCPLDLFCNSAIAIYPFLVKLEKFPPSFNRDEVADIFTVPLAWFLNNKPARHDLELLHQRSDSFPYHLINGGENYRFRYRADNELFYIYGKRVIWGLTARLIWSFVNILKNESPNKT